ncbi:MAG: cyclic nucleotide-binding domain-containing protein [bacterium]|jgi:CRP-like cAMP-binding protein|nr:cyclic nucleotide-binding domain-containing protein [bacterium]
MRITPETLPLLGAFPLTAPLAGDPAALELLAGILEERRYRAGDQIVHKGERGDCAFLLVDGEVEVLDYTMDREPYTRAVLDSAEHPLFGEVALVGDGERIATVEARTNCLCWVLRREAFERLGDQHPRVGLALLRHVAHLLAGHLQKTNRDVLHLFEALVLEIEQKAVGGR